MIGPEPGSTGTFHDTSEKAAAAAQYDLLVDGGIRLFPAAFASINGGVLYFVASFYGGVSVDGGDFVCLW
eukprot:2768056-Rhodomonas_salina.2